MFAVCCSKAYRSKVRFLKLSTELLQINPARYSIDKKRDEMML